MKLKKVFEPYFDKLDWKFLSKNPNAIHLIEQNIREGGDYINWHGLCSNPNAIDILDQYIQGGGNYL